jgi:hypothetical protein
MRGLEMRRQHRMLRPMTTGFAPIRLADYVERHLRSNPDTDRADLIDRLHYAIAAFQAGRALLSLWTADLDHWIGEVGLSCFHMHHEKSEPDRTTRLT